MAKDRNTFAKRQREVDKKRKADEKRTRRAKKKLSPDEPSEPTQAPTVLSAAERSVLSVFRKYLMTPGKMLCLSGSDLEAFRVPLFKLKNKGLLDLEKPDGGYSLTETGFAAMQDDQ